MLSTQSEGTPLTHAEPAHHLVRLLGWCGHAVRNSIQPPMTQSGPHAKRRVESTKRTTLLQAGLFDYCVSARNPPLDVLHVFGWRSNCLRLSLSFPPMSAWRRTR